MALNCLKNCAGLLACLLFGIQAFAQQGVNILSGQPKQALQQVYVLPDRQYSFEQVAADTTLPFTPGPLLQPDSGSVFWLKLVIDNPSQYAGKYTVYQHPILDNTFYCFNYDQGKWMATRTGALVAGQTRRYSTATCTIQGKSRNVLYIKADVSLLKKYHRPVKAVFTIEQEELTRQIDQKAWIVSLATLLIVCIFLFYNGVVYFHVKDRAYLFYLFIQLGGILYIAGNFYYFIYFIPWRNFTAWLSPSGIIYYYHLNTFLQRIAIIIILAGFVQFTRSYLQTRLTLPRADTYLKYLLRAWVVFEAGYNLVSFTGIRYVDLLFNTWSNLCIILMIGSVLAVSVMATVKKIPAARYFLWSNVVTLGLMTGLAIYYIVMPSGSRNLFLPCICIIAQALMYAIALLERVRYFKKEVAARQVEAEALKTEIEQLEEKYGRLTTVHEKIQAAVFTEKTKNEQLAGELEASQRELASAALYIAQKNDLLAGLKKQIENLNRLPRQLVFKNIEDNLKNNQFLDESWEKFKLHFEQVHPRFFAGLQEKYPALTQYELRLCAYMHMNLSTKEIAGLLNINPDSVRKAKTRLGKKMDLAAINTTRA